jgi:alpha-1,3-rhamnosyl/mannosyltransferase
MPMYRARAGHVVTIHDLTFFSLPDCHRALHRSVFYRRAVLASIRRANVITVPSAATRDHIATMLPTLPRHRTRVIPQGIGEEFRVHDPASIRSAAQRLRLPSSYLLYVGTIEPRKNLGQLVEAYRRLVTIDGIREDLVIAGRLGWKYDAVLAQLQAPELRGRVHLTGYIDQADLPLVYGGAKVFVYPSLQEGFGFPPLEAMASGVPTVSSRSSSLSENLEDAAELVPPGDLVALTDAIRRLLKDDARRSCLTARGLERAARYRWENTAQQTLDCYEQAALREVVPRSNCFSAM